MFAGISQLYLDEQQVTILGMISKEGEHVDFIQSISLKDGPKINEWLSAVERQMQLTLASIFEQSFVSVTTLLPTQKALEVDNVKLLEWINQFPAQLVVLAFQTISTSRIETAIESKSLLDFASLLENILSVLADAVLKDLKSIERLKCEQLITELVHERDVIRSLIKEDIKSSNDFQWLYHMRYYYSKSNKDTGSVNEDPLKRLNIRMANASFYYGELNSLFTQNYFMYKVIFSISKFICNISKFFPS